MINKNNLGSLKKRMWARLFDTLLLIINTIIFYFVLSFYLKNILFLTFFSWFFFCCLFFIFNVLIPYFTNGYTLFKKFFGIKLFCFNDSQFQKLKFWPIFLRETLIIFLPLSFLFLLTFLDNLSFWSSIPSFGKIEWKEIVKRFGYLSLLLFFLYHLFILKKDQYHQSRCDRFFHFFILSTTLFVKMKTMNDQKKQQGYFVNLNYEQQKCAFFDQKANLRILAGPGTGKTTVLIERFLFLVNVKKIDPQQILVLTFTRKAAQNFCDRLKSVFKNYTKSFNVFTYHGFCYRFLRKEIPYFNQDGHVFTILDTQGQRKIFKKLLKSLNFNDFNDFDDKNFIKDLSKVIEFLQKNNILTIKDLQNQKSKRQLKSFLTSFKIEFVYSFYQSYLQYKKQNYLFDYIDLLRETNIVLKEKGKVCAKYQQFYRYLMIDEFQDIDLLQYQLVLLLSENGTKMPLTIVGDPDQNIYQWRGADIKFILDFDRHFKPTQTFALTHNYRSTQKIVALANALIKNNQNRIPKILKATKEEGANIKIFYHNDLYQQGNFLAIEIKKLIKQNVDPQEIAILFRYNKNGAILEKSFIEHLVPYQIFKGYHFFQRIEIKTLLTLLSLILEPKNYYFEDLLLSIKGFGEKTLQKILIQANNMNLSLFDYLATNTPSFLKQFDSKIKFYLRSIQRLMTFINENRSLKELVQEIYQVFVEEELKKQLLYQNRLENINILINDLICEFEKRVASQKLTLAAKITNFLGEIDFQSFKDNKVQSKVTLMTIHSSKGLEFDHLFIFDISDNHAHFSLNSLTQTEEERRLFFVALTRARKTITISGSSFNESPFLEELKTKKQFLEIKNDVKSAWKLDVF